MLIFSAILDIAPTLTKEAFIRLVMKWNRESKYSENVIPDMEWHNEYNITYGNDDLWLKIREYRKENIIAVRYEKRDEKGVIWDTDYIMNFREKKMAVRLHRSYAADALTHDTRFSTPHFITLLIEGGYLKDDGLLPVGRTPFILDENRLEVIADIINEKTRYTLPVVYVSKTYYDEDPVDVNIMAGRLKGIAHVLLQECMGTNDMLRDMCDSRNEYYGAIGIYYPNPALPHRKYLYHGTTDQDDALMEKVICAVMAYTNSRAAKTLYTWEGVDAALLKEHLDAQVREREKADIARREAQAQAEQLQDSLDEEEKRIRRKAFDDARHESDMILQSYDEDFRRIRDELDRQTARVEAMEAEILGLRARLSASESVPVLYMGEETEFYQGEIKDFILSVLSDALRTLPDQSRRKDVIRDIVDNNEYMKYAEQKAEEVKRLLKDYSGMTPKLRQALEDMGFVITEDGKHLKLTYFNDDRYVTVYAKTPSDHRSGKNNASKTIRIAF